jgi:hypothetical protein
LRTDAQGMLVLASNRNGMSIWTVYEPKENLTALSSPA